MDMANQEILIYGSSRAQHHYLPDTITKYTGLSCYNCGIGGQGPIFSFLQINEMLKRHTPKLILLDLSPNILLDAGCNVKVKELMPYIKRDTLIENVFFNISIYEKIKNYSSMYPYNGNILALLTYFRHKMKNENKGFIPIYGRLDTTNFRFYNSVPDTIPENEFYYLFRIINLCKAKKVTLKLIISPIYKKSAMDNYVIKKIRIIGSKTGTSFLDFSDFFSAGKDVRLFRDNLHLNLEGASEFSAGLCRRTKLAVSE